jgi:hypothetical protein
MDIRSRRKTKLIESIFVAVVIDPDGQEGVVRRDTPSGTQPWTTDDPELASTMLRIAQQMPGCSDAYLVRFDRAEVYQ